MRRTKGTTESPSGWSGTIGAFLAMPEAGWLAAVQEHYRQSMGSPAGHGQVLAWEHESGILGREFKQLVQARPAFGNFTLLFDYAPSRPRTWHPDLIILAAPIYILAFRGDDRVLQAHTDQVDAFAEDLRRYHAGSRDATIVPALVHTRAKDLIVRDGDVIILSPDRIADFLMVESELETGPLIDPAAWIAAGYFPPSPGDR